MKPLQLTPQQVTVIRSKNSETRGAISLLDAYIDLLQVAYDADANMKEIYWMGLAEVHDHLVECYWNMVDCWMDCGIDC